MDTCYCPEISKDANGLTGFIGLRYYLMWLVKNQSYIKLKLNEWKNSVFNLLYLWSLLLVKGLLFFYKGGGGYGRGAVV